VSLLEAQVGDLESQRSTAAAEAEDAATRLGSEERARYPEVVEEATAAQAALDTERSRAEIEAREYQAEIHRLQLALRSAKASGAAVCGPDEADARTQVSQVEYTSVRAELDAALRREEEAQDTLDTARKELMNALAQAKDATGALQEAQAATSAAETRATGAEEALQEAQAATSAAETRATGAEEALQEAQAATSAAETRATGAEEALQEAQAATSAAEGALQEAQVARSAADARSTAAEQAVDRARRDAAAAVAAQSAGESELGSALAAAQAEAQEAKQLAQDDALRLQEADAVAAAARESARHAMDEASAALQEAAEARSTLVQREATITELEAMLASLREIEAKVGEAHTPHIGSVASAMSREPSEHEFSAEDEVTGNNHHAFEHANGGWRFSHCESTGEVSYEDPMYEPAHLSRRETAEPAPCRALTRQGTAEPFFISSQLPVHHHVHSEHGVGPAPPNIQTSSPVAGGEVEAAEGIAHPSTAGLEVFREESADSPAGDVAPPSHLEVGNGSVERGSLAAENETLAQAVLAVRRWRDRVSTARIQSSLPAHQGHVHGAGPVWPWAGTAAGDRSRERLGAPAVVAESCHVDAALMGSGSTVPGQSGGFIQRGGGQYNSAGGGGDTSRRVLLREIGVERARVQALQIELSQLKRRQSMTQIQESSSITKLTQDLAAQRMHNRQLRGILHAMSVSPPTPPEPAAASAEQ